MQSARSNFAIVFAYRDTFAGNPSFLVDIRHCGTHDSEPTTLAIAIILSSLEQLRILVNSLGVNADSTFRESLEDGEPGFEFTRATLDRLMLLASDSLHERGSFAFIALDVSATEISERLNQWREARDQKTLR